MTNLQKNILYWVGVVLLSTVIGFVVVSTNKSLESATTTNTVSFSGTGKVLAKPDVALIDLTILTEGTTSKAAQDENSKKSRALTDFLKGQGIDEKDIKTSGYNIYPQYYYPPYPDVRGGGTPRITGYQVNQTVQVKVRDLEKTDTILDGVVSAGVNQVNNLQLTVDNPEALQDEARRKAIDDARSKAGNLVSQLGIRLGRIINFSENAGGYPVPMMYAKDVAIGMGGGGGGPSVPTGENEITVNVTITYQIR